MAGVQYCRWQTKSATIADGYLPTAEKWFGLDEAALAAKYGRFTRGKRKGAARGWLVWRKCIEGGWSRSHGGVVRPGIVHAHLVGTYEEVGLIVRNFVGGLRVDTSYGFDPAAARKAQELSELIDQATAGWPIITNWTAEQDAALDKWVDACVPSTNPRWVWDQVKALLKLHCIQREMDAFEIEQVVRVGAASAVQRAAGAVVNANA